MKSSNPYLSVLMTSYNRELYISESILSILNQSFRNFELIIVDDASSDTTVSIAKYYEKVDSRIKVYVNSQNLGDYPNRNLAASYATGDYIIFCDSDDSLNQNALEYIVDSFNSNPEAKHSSIYYGPANSPFLMDSRDAIQTHFFKSNILSCGPSARVFKTEFYKGMNGYPQKYGPANDMYFNIKTTSNSPILLLPYSYLNYRIHEGQESNNLYSYIHNGYNYFKDVLSLEEVPLSDDKKLYLLKKNKRRFIVNSFKYFFTTFSICKTIKLFKIVNFSAQDFFVGIFQF